MGYTVVGGVRSRAFRALWLLEEMGLPYDHVAAGPRTGDVTKYSPSGKIPLLLDGDAVLTDSAAIMTYLADKHGAFTYPAGTLERAKQDGWTFRIIDELDALLWTAARHSFVLPEDQRVPEVKDSLKAEYARNLERLAGEMTGPFLMGDQMTVPDILLVHCANWAKNAGFPDAPDAFTAYADRLRDRPAFRAVAAM